MKKYLLLFLFIFMSHLYADTNGAYGELLLGRGYNHLDEKISGSNSTNWTLSGKLGVGYKIDKYIGLEAGYEQFGQRRFNNLDGTAASAVTNENALEIQTVIRFALNDNLSLLGKIGPAYVQATTSLNGGDAQITNQYQANHSAWCADYAIGASYVLDDFPGLELTAIYSHIVKNDNIPDADLYAAGLIFNF